VLTAPPIEPVVARNGATDCTNQKTGGITGLPSPLTANLIFASTSVDKPTAPAEQRAIGAAGGIGELAIRVLPQMNIPIPKPDLSGLPPELQAVVEPLLPTVVPDTDLLRVSIANAVAQGRCVDGRPALDGTSSVAGLTLFGKQLPTDRIIDQAISIDTAAIDPSTLIGAVSSALPATPLNDLTADLGAAGPIAIPSVVGRVRIVPNEQTIVNGRLTQRALQVHVELGGQTIADVVLGEAVVSHGQIDCAPVTTAAQAALQCTARKLVLADVLPAGRRVKLLGFADPTLVGKRVSLRFTATGAQVANPIVRKDGSFSATAPMPPRSIRFTNRARYIAVHGKEKSLRLKLMRRMIVREVRVGSTHIRIMGQVVKPLSTPLRKVALTRRISCSRSVVVKRFMPRKDGRFSVLVAAPPNKEAGVYRMETRVRKNRTNPKQYPTFTLPRYVETKS
jgi:hypothetical protein